MDFKLEFEWSGSYLSGRTVKYSNVTTSFPKVKYGAPQVLVHICVSTSQKLAWRYFPRKYNQNASVVYKYAWNEMYRQAVNRWRPIMSKDGGLILLTLISRFVESA